MRFGERYREEVLTDKSGLRKLHESIFNVHCAVEHSPIHEINPSHLADLQPSNNPQSSWHRAMPLCGTAKSVRAHPKLCPASQNLTSHIASIERMLNLNRDAQEASEDHHNQSTSNGLPIPATPILSPNGDPIWKVLVFDDLGRDVISSVLRVNDLRTWGVTMHMFVLCSLTH